MFDRDCNMIPQGVSGAMFCSAVCGAGEKVISLAFSEILTCQLFAVRLEI